VVSTQPPKPKIQPLQIFSQHSRKNVSVADQNNALKKENEQLKREIDRLKETKFGKKGPGAGMGIVNQRPAGPDAFVSATFSLSLSHSPSLPPSSLCLCLCLCLSSLFSLFFHSLSVDVDVSVSLCHCLFVCFCLFLCLCCCLCLFSLSLFSLSLSQAHLCEGLISFKFNILVQSILSGKSKAEAAAGPLSDPRRFHATEKFSSAASLLLLSSTYAL